MIFENVASQQICAIFIDAFLSVKYLYFQPVVTCSYEGSPESLRCIHYLAEDALYDQE